MTITVWILSADRATASALPAVDDVVSDGIDTTDSTYVVTGANVTHIIPLEFLYRVQKDQ